MISTSSHRLLYVLPARTDGLALGGLLAALLHDRERLEQFRGHFQIGFAALGSLAATAPIWGWRVFGGVPLFTKLQAVWPGLDGSVQGPCPIWGR